MKKILFVHHAAGWGGAPKCMANLIQSLNKNKYEVKVLLLKKSIVAIKLNEYGIDYEIAQSVFYRKYYRFFAHSEAGYYKWYQLFSIIRVGLLWFCSKYYFAPKELARHDFDIIHLNSSVLTDWLRPSKKSGKKVVIHVREPFRNGNIDFLNFFFRKQISKYADQVIAISNDNARRISIPNKTTMIYDFCDEPLKNPDDISYRSKRVLYLGGASTSKGFYVLVDALDFLNMDIKVLFAGNIEVTPAPNSLMSYCKYIFSHASRRDAAIKKIKNHPNAILVGMVDNVSELLDQVCCLVSPFIVPHFSCPVIEAHMHKKPAIASDVEGMEEIVRNTQTGLIVKKLNSGELAMAMNKLASEDTVTKSYGLAGYKIAKEKFTSDNVKQFEKLYDNL